MRVVPVCNLSLDSHTQHGTERLLTALWCTPFRSSVLCFLHCFHLTRNTFWLELRSPVRNPFLSYSSTKPEEIVGDR